MAKMLVGASKVDITPSSPVWMDGMIREHKSVGVHDRLFARALYLSSGLPNKGCVIVSADVCAIRYEDAQVVREKASARTGIPFENIVIAATHTHSGPATKGFFNPTEEGYLAEFREQLVSLIEQASKEPREAVIGCVSSEERTISHYRRLLADDGHVVMNWEPWPAERIVRALGEPDHEVGVIVAAEDTGSRKCLCIAFNHAGHPNVMSGENYLLSADYPGYACARIEEAVGGMAMFLNGAEGSVDIDGLKDRDWEGVARAGSALADAVIQAVKRVDLCSDPPFCTIGARYALPPRRITPAELEWAEIVLASTGGKIQAHADGIGDDFKAALYKNLAAIEDPIAVEQTCIALGDTALLSFPGELFAEIGREIKTRSPFAKTYIIGLANGSVGYVPTRESILQGGYEVDTRRVGDESAEIVINQSLRLLNSAFAKIKQEG